jgi:hypothetical protein
VDTILVFILCFCLAISVGEGVERAVLGDNAKPDKCGTLLGWLICQSISLVGVVSITAGAPGGKLQQSQGARVAYAFAVVIGLIACAILHFNIARHTKNDAAH